MEPVQRIIALMGSDLDPDVRNQASNEIRHQYLSAAKAR
jgi:CDP-glucose 4,6-dehydratase